MNKEQPTNPPAFPHEVEWNIEGVTGRYPEAGMTLRDYFASRASEEDIHEHRLKYFQNADGSRVSKWIYESSREAGKYAYADAMLAEREAK